MDTIIAPITKTSEELIQSGLVNEYEAEEMPKYWKETIVLIFPNKTAAVNYVRKVLVPKIGKEKLTSIWFCLTGPSDEDALGEAIGILLDANEKWLLFKKEDFESIIQPAM